jgi:integrase
MVFGEHRVRLFQRNDQPSNYWFMRVSFEGKQFRRSLKTCVLEEAKKAVNGHMVDVLAKQKAGQKVFGTTLKDFRDAYLLFLQTRQERGELSALTLRNLIRHVSLGMDFLRSEDHPGSMAMDRVDGKLWQQYADCRLKTVKKRRDGIHQELVSIRAGFEWARRQGWCTDKNIPNWELKLEKTQATRDKLTHRQFYRALQLMREWVVTVKGKARLRRELVHVAFRTIANSGLRTGECLKLTMRDIQVGNSEIILTIRDTTTKVRKSRQVPILHSGGAYLRGWLHRIGDRKPNDLVFVVGKSKDASIMFYRQFNNFKKSILKPVGLEQLDPYHARHQWISERLESGESIHLVAKLAGISTTQIEKTYSGVIDLVIGREFAKKKLHYNEADGSVQVIKRDTEWKSK